MILIKIVAIFISVYLLLCLYLYYFQEKEIFFPPLESPIINSIPDENKISIDINGVTLKGISTSKIDNKNSVIIYFGGNAEDVYYNFSDFVKELNSQFVAINYRGFSVSEGTPTINNLLHDAKIIVDRMIEDHDLNPKHIFLMGRSLGAAIAVQLSIKRKYAGIILVSPFDSMTNIAKRYFPLFPVSLLIKHPLDSLEIAKKSRTPLLILAAENDSIIPIKYSKALFDSWSSANKKMAVITGVGHNTIHNGFDYYPTINEFISIYFRPHSVNNLTK